VTGDVDTVSVGVAGSEVLVGGVVTVAIGSVVEVRGTFVLVGTGVGGAVVPHPDSIKAVAITTAVKV
jgi:hypothetical protein